MAKIKVGEENSTPIELYYEDHGSGQPVVLIHGWPLSGASWEKQTAALLDSGYRVITYDRRGFGRSDQPAEGYNYDTFAADLDAILTHLDVRECVLAGFSMGSGEVTRYIARYGSARVAKAVLIGVIPPFLLQTADNPDGVPQNIFDDIKQGIVDDRPAYLVGFLKNFYNVGFLTSDISDEAFQASWNVAVQASAIGTLKCVDSWLEDFRDDSRKIDVPTLIIHGDADKILPIDNTANRLVDYISGSRLEIVSGAPHGMCWTHAAEINRALLSFLGTGTRTAAV